MSPAEEDVIFDILHGVTVSWAGREILKKEISRDYALGEVQARRRIRDLRR